MKNLVATSKARPRTMTFAGSPIAMRKAAYFATAALLGIAAGVAEPQSAAAQGFAGGAMSGPGPQSLATPLIPTGGATPRSLSDISALLNPTPYASQHALFKPYHDNQLVTSSGLNGNAWVYSFEVPTPFTAVKLVFANQTANTFKISALAAAASAQWDTPGAMNTDAMGVSVYDETGADVTATAGTFTVASWGNGGAIADWYTMPSSYAALASGLTTYSNIAASTTASTCSGSTLNVASATGVAAYQRVLITNPVNDSNTDLHVASSYTSGTAVLLDQPVSCTPGATVIFLPASFVVPAVLNPEVPNLAVTDTINVVSRKRIDGPVVSGELLYDADTDQPIGSLAVNVVGPTSVSLTGGTLPADLPAGKSVEFCTPVTMASTITPTNAIPVSGTNFAVAGLTASLGATTIPYGRTYNAVWSSPITSVDSGHIYTASNVNPPQAGSSFSGAFIVEYQLSVSGDQSSPTSTVTVANDTLLSALATIASGTNLYVLSTNTANSWTPTKINSINAGAHTLTLASPTVGILKDGQPLRLYFQQSISGSLSVPPAFNVSSAPVNNVLAGDKIVGAAWPADTHISVAQKKAWQLDKYPLSTVSSGDSIMVCHKPIPLSAPAQAGSSSLAFTQTVYKGYILQVRIDYASDNGAVVTNYNLGNGGDWGKGVSLGVPNYMGGYCSSGAGDGIGSPNNLRLGSGGCNMSRGIQPVYAIMLNSPVPALTMMNINGDSKWAGNGTPINTSNFLTMAAYDMWSASLPTSPVNCSWGGAFSNILAPLGRQCVELADKGVAVIDGYMNNNSASAQSYALTLGQSVMFQNVLRKRGWLPIIADDYPGAMWGLTTLGAVNTYQVAGRAYLSAACGAAAPGSPCMRGISYFDTTSIIGEQHNGQWYLSSAYSSDGLHADLNGHRALANVYRQLIAPVTRQPRRRRRRRRPASRRMIRSSR